MCSAILHKSYFMYCCICLIFLCASLTDPVRCTATFYKLVGKDGDPSVDDKNVPFLTRAFFTCGSNEDCTRVAKIKGSSEFKMVIGQQKVEKDAVVYEKVSTPRAYELYKCKQARTRFTDGRSSTFVRTAGTSWLPLVDLTPSCISSGNNFIMTSAGLETNGTHLRYNYSCCAFKVPICHMMLTSTEWMDGHSGVILAISRHPIDCGEFGFISSFHLQRNSENIRYSYACCEVVDQTWKDLMQCINFTRLVVIRGFHTLTLAEIPISCDAGFGLSRLTLHMSNDKRQWGFEFRCCKVAN